MTQATAPTRELTNAPQRAAESNGHAITAQGLCLTYPTGNSALCGVNLTIPQGQNVAVLGNSGSGKTSLLRCMSGALQPTRGHVQAQGRIAFIHQDLRLVKQRTALQNVLHGAMGRLPLWRTIAWFPRHEREKAIALLKRVGLEHRIHARVGRLSGGEQQRVAIARALMQDPAIILADEPVASLDNANARGIMKLLHDLGEDRNLTVVSVLHDCALAETYADRIVGLEGGHVAYDGPPGTRTFAPACMACQTISAAAEAAEQEHRRHDRPGLDSHLSRTWGFVTAAVIAVLVYAWALTHMSITGRELQGALPGMGRFLADLVPQSWSELSNLAWGPLLGSLVETLQMSLIGTTLGVLISWPLAALAAKNVGPRWVFGPVRFLLNAVRTVPSLIWALLFVAAVGFGTLAGVLALVAYSIGYLTKFFYEAFEAVDPGPPGALRDIGASGMQRFLHAVWPAARPAVLSSSLFMFEYNVRAASVLGVVDAGGIGFYIKQYLDYRQFPAAMVCLVLLLAVVVVLDAVSTRVRARLVAN